MVFRAPRLPASGLSGSPELAENLGLGLCYGLRDIGRGRAALRVHDGRSPGSQCLVSCGCVPVLPFIMLSPHPDYPFTLPLWSRSSSLCATP